MTATSVNTIVEISMASLVLDLFVDEQGSGTSRGENNKDDTQIKIKQCIIFVCFSRPYFGMQILNVTCSTLLKTKFEMTEIDPVHALLGPLVRMVN